MRTSYVPRLSPVFLSTIIICLFELYRTIACARVKDYLRSNALAYVRIDGVHRRRSKLCIPAFYDT